MTRRRLLALAGGGAALAGLAWAGPAVAQSISVDMGEQGGDTTAHIMRLIALLTVLSLAPGILMMVTSFTRIVVCLSILRQAIGTQQSPPNMVLISLALFMTMFIMAPVFRDAYDRGIEPVMQNEMEVMQGLERAAEPFRTFMLKNTRSKDIDLFMEVSDTEPVAEAEDTPYEILIPAFMISEMRRAFEIGFLLYVPFLVIDMLIASVLMSMGMMMLPPIMVALPFKLIFFVLVDGWYLVAGSLIRSFNV